MHPADIADVFEVLDEAEKKKLFQQLDIDTTSEVIAEISEFSKDQILADLPHQRLGEIVDELESDDTADLLASVPREVAEKVLASIDAKDSQKVRRLLQYDEEAAGGIMQAQLLAVPQEATVADAIDSIRQVGESLEELGNIFVISSGKQLVGELSLQRLILADPNDPISEVIETDLRAIPVDLEGFPSCLSLKKDADTFEPMSNGPLLCGTPKALWRA
jgi:magnesium transporter